MSTPSEVRAKLFGDQTEPEPTIPVQRQFLLTGEAVDDAVWCLLQVVQYDELPIPFREQCHRIAGVLQRSGFKP